MKLRFKGGSSMAKAKRMQIRPTRVTSSGHDETCPDCHGSGKINGHACEKCHGTGHVPGHH